MPSFRVTVKSTQNFPQKGKKKPIKFLICYFEKEKVTRKINSTHLREGTTVENTGDKGKIVLPDWYSSLILNDSEE